MTIKKIIRKLKLRFYETNKSIPKVLGEYYLVGSFVVLLTIILNFGFNNILIKEQNLIILTVSLFYIISYIIRGAIQVNFWQFIKNNKLLTIITAIITTDVINIFFLDYFYDQLSNSRITIVLLIQFYFFFDSLSNTLKNDTDLNKKPISPPILLIISFSSLIIVGTLLLMMPEISSSGKSLGLKNALFTSVSASTVTGLTILDTALDFSFKGQFIILLLIQLGGVNIIAFATFFALFSRKGLGIEQQKMISENFNTQNLLSGKSLLIRVFTFSVIIELIGTLIIFSHYAFDHKMLFESIFHSISAFNNAGFILSEDFFNSLNLKWCFTILIFLGAIGFPTLSDVVSNTLKKRNWKTLHLTSKISILSSMALIILGATMLFTLENNNLSANENTFEKITNLIFHSTSGRTAGFTAIDFSSLGFPILIIFTFLMFIGASPGSFGGGIKTNTFVLIIYSFVTTIRGKKSVEIFNRKISSTLLYKSFSILLFALIVILCGWIGLLITEPNTNPIFLLFEQTSAFSTVGLSAGNTTEELSNLGQIIIIITMFVGRIGTLLMAFSLIQKKKTPNYNYPKAHIMVG